MVVDSVDFAMLSDEIDVHGSYRGKIALVGKVGAFFDVDRFDQFRNLKIQIGPALSVAMRAHVDGHPVDGNRQIGPVVEIDAAQKVLVRFAFAAMLRDHQTGDDLKGFGGPREGPCVDLFAADVFLAGRGDRLTLRCIGRTRYAVDRIFR